MKAKINHTGRTINLAAENEDEQKFLSDVMGDRIERTFVTENFVVKRLELEFVKVEEKRAQGEA